MNPNEKLIAIIDGDWKDCSLSLMIVPQELPLQERRDHNEKEFPNLSFEEYLKKVNCGRDAGPEDAELYATGIDPNRKPNNVQKSE